MLVLQPARKRRQPSQGRIGLAIAGGGPIGGMYELGALRALDVAIEALKDARSKRKASADELWHYAKICRVANVMRPYLEAIE